MTIKLKRAYANISDEDGIRILVDRLWPRGLSKEKLKLDLWLKDIGPSTELRKWFNHDPQKFEEFKVRYIDELEEKRGVIEQLKEIVDTSKEPVTFVFAARNEIHNHAVLLKEMLDTGRI